MIRTPSIAVFITSIGSLCSKLIKNLIQNISLFLTGILSHQGKNITSLKNKFLLAIKQITHAFAERVCPVGDGDSEGGFYLGFIQHREGGALYRAGEFIAMAGLNVAASIASNRRNHLGEVIPGADTFVTKMVNSTLRVTFSG